MNELGSIRQDIEQTRLGLRWAQDSHETGNKSQAFYELLNAVNRLTDAVENLVDLTEVQHRPLD